MEVEDNAVAFVLTCPSLPLVVHEARLDAVAWLKHLLHDDFMVGLGALRLEAVPLVEVGAECVASDLLPLRNNMEYVFGIDETATQATQEVTH